MDLGKTGTQNHSYLDRDLKVENSGLGRMGKSQVMPWHVPLLLQNPDPTVVVEVGGKTEGETENSPLKNGVKLGVSYILD